MSKDQDFKKMSRQSNSLQLRGVNVTFNGVKALDSFTGIFSAGSLSAFTGGDGAGKTTLLKLLAGRVEAASGKITRLPDKERIGYQPADSGVWRDMTVLENLRFVSGIYHMNPAHDQERIDYKIESAGLIDARNRLGGQLSRGMRQKLGVIMAALMNLTSSCSTSRLQASTRPVAKTYSLCYHPKRSKVELSCSLQHIWTRGPCLDSVSDEQGKASVCGRFASYAEGCTRQIMRGRAQHRKADNPAIFVRILTASTPSAACLP